MFVVKYKDNIVGHTKFEFGDPPMGIVHGDLLSEKLDKITKLNVSISEGSIQIYEGFEIYTSDGEKIETAGAVSIQNDPSMPPPFDWQIAAHYIDSDIYEKLFPHHVEKYNNSFQGK